MKDVLITKLSVRNLERLFSPLGLPVVDKGADVPTTSIAILGDAGAGKTTLAVSMAQAIAEQLQGIALYLTTELAPTEIKYKVALLGLPGKVLAWSNRAQAVPGDIVGQHVALLDDGSERPIRRRALEAAWHLTETPSAHSPIRCVVVDAFPLPDLSKADGRDEIVALVQALEGRGISIIIVQEAAGSTDYVPFVADIVFQLRFDEDPDTGERIRKLACPKSRYARSIVGPHDTGLDHGRVAVWPDPLAIAASSRMVDLPRVRSPCSVFVPVAMPDRYIVSNAGSVMLSSFHSGGWLIQALQQTSGVEFLTVDCGPMTYVGAGDRSTTVPDSEGAYSLAWAILNEQQRSGKNAVLIQNLDNLLRRARFRAPLEHVLEALRLSDLLVCVHGAGLAELSSLCDFEADGKYKGAGVMTPRSHRPAAAWLYLDHWPASLQVSSTAGADDLARVNAATRQTLELFDSSLEEEALNAVQAVSVRTQEIGSHSAMLRMAVVLHLLGFEELARSRIATDARDVGFAPLAWANAALGSDWIASQLIVTGMRLHLALSRDVELLWASFSAIYAASAPAFDQIVQALDTMPVLLDTVIRSLAARQRWDEVDAAIARVGDKLRLGPILVGRLRAEARLEGPVATCAEAAARLQELLTRSDIPRAHRVAMLHNRGVALARLGHHDEARNLWREALALHPRYEPASRCLAGGIVAPP